MHHLEDPQGPLKTQYNPLKSLLGPPDFGLQDRWLSEAYHHRSPAPPPPGPRGAVDDAGGAALQVAMPKGSVVLFTGAARRGRSSHFSCVPPPIFCILMDNHDLLIKHTGRCENHTC